MAKKQTSRAGWLQTNAIRVTRVHFLYAVSYMLALVVFDSWNLYTHDAIVQRWTLAAILFILTTVLWYLSRLKFSTDSLYVALVLLLVLADIVFAATNVYWERGMASRSVALFAIPIITAASLRSRSILLASTALSMAAYSLAAVRYFFQHYGEGYRVELWGNLLFYSAVFFVFGWLLMVIIRPTNESL
jgi:hypothetical protein